MACVKPLHAFMSLDRKTENGKALIVFKRKEAGNLSKRVDLPCGRCIGCRIDKSRDWAIRCVHEASLYEYNCFITLTFCSGPSIKHRDCKHIISDELTSLRKSDFQKFMKRLRKKYQGLQEVEGKYPIRYFHCGEYGEQFDRPHHHACLFNFDFLDKELFLVRDGVKLYRSDALEELWPYGFCTIGDVTFQSAAYVARYVTKKINGDMAKAHYANVDYSTGEILSYKQPEYCTMSRRPGIARSWYNAFNKDLYPKDFITHEGAKVKIPRYYDKIFDSVNPVGLQDIKKKRLERMRAHAIDNTDRRLCVKGVCMQKRTKNLKRGFENESTVI